MRRRATRTSPRTLMSIVLATFALAIAGTQVGVPASAAGRNPAKASRTQATRAALIGHAAPISGPFGDNYYDTQLTDASYGFNGGLSVIYDGTHIWTANQAGNSLTEVDAATGALIRVVSGAKYGFNHPWTLALAGGYLWVTNPSGNSVTEVNATDGSFVRVLTGAQYGFNTPRGLTSFFGHLWVSNEFGNSLTEIKASDASVMRVISGGSYAFSHPNTITDDGDHVWVTNNTGNSVTELNDSDGKWVRTISGAQYGFSVLAGITYINGHVWVSSWSVSAPAVTEINAADGAFITRIAMPAPRPVGIVGFDGYVWVVLWEGSSLVQISESSGTIVHTYGPTDGNFSYPQALTTDGNNLWVLNAGNASLTEISDPPDPKRPDVMSQLDEGASGTYKETVSALITPNGLPTTYRAEWGTAQDRYDHVGPNLPTGGVLNSPRPTRVFMQLTGLPFLQPVHWRIVATNGRGTHYGVDEITEWYKFFGVQPQVCVTHLQWQLITADIVGPGCWVGHAPRVPQNAKLAVPPPAPYNPGSACNILAGPCPPPKQAPPPPPLYVSGGEMAQIPQASGPIMTAIPMAAGKPVTVEINGTLITSGYVVADQPRGYIKANDASVDLAGSADGTVPPTPLARHATISTAIPSRYGPIFTGASLQHSARQPHTPALSCNDPMVQNAPLLGDFKDPSGIGASLGDLNLGGGHDPVSVHIINSRVVVCVNINLPMAPCASPTPTFGVKATLIADQSGLTLQDLNAHLDCGLIAGVVFQDLSFSFTNTDKKWSAQGTVQAIPGLPLTGIVEFAKGAFTHAGLSSAPPALYFGFLRLKQVGFDVYPDKTTGTVAFGSPLSVPFTSADALTIDGGYEYNWGANPSYLAVNGKVGILGDPIANGNLTLFTDGTATGNVHFKSGIAGVFTAEADVKADFWHTSPLRFNVDGTGSASLFDFISVSGEVVVSDNGAGACVDGTALDLGHFGLVVHSDGSVSAWAPVEGGCDISSARDVKPAATKGGRAPRAVSSLQVPVAANTKGVFIGVQGKGGMPAFSLDGPNGEHRDVAATGTINDSTGVVFHDTTNEITYVGVPHPSAGTWTVTAAQGSPLLDELRTGTVNDPIAVTAKVVRKGTGYQLQYSGPKVLGQSVQFLERGTGDVAAIGTALGGGTGSINFTPHAGTGTARTLVAVVTQNGLPRGEVTAGSYAAPAPKAPGKVTHVVFTRRGNVLQATWPRVAGATGYSSVVRTTDGRSRVLFSSKPGLSFASLTHAQGATLRLVAVNGKLRGPATLVVANSVSLGFKGVSAASRNLKFGATQTTLRIGVGQPATVKISIIGSKAVLIATLTKKVHAGSSSITVRLTSKGKPLPRGTYTVVVATTAAGYASQGTAFTLTIK